MGWTLRRIARTLRAVLIALVLVCIAVALWNLLSTWSLPGPGIIVNKIALWQGAPRTLSASAEVDYGTNGAITVTIERTAAVHPDDELAGMIESGSIEHQQPMFDEMFGLNLYAGFSVVSQSLVTSTTSTSILTAHDETVLRLYPGPVGLVVEWWPLGDESTNTSTLALSVRGGVIVGVAAASAADPAHTDTSIFLSTATTSASVRNVQIALVPDGASAAQTPVLAGTRYIAAVPGPTPAGLGSDAAQGAMALAAALLGYPAFCALVGRRARGLVPADAPAITVSAAGAGAAAITTGLWSYLSAQSAFLVAIGLAVMLLVAALAQRRPLGLGPLLVPWTNAVVAFCFAAGAAMCLFIPGASSRPVMSATVALACLLAALALAWRASSPYPRLLAVLAPGAVLAYVSDEYQLGLFSLDRGALDQWIETAALPGAVAAVSVTVVLLGTVGSLRLERRGLYGVLLACSLVGMPLLGINAEGTPYWTGVSQAMMCTVLLAAFTGGLLVLRRTGREPGSLGAPRSVDAAAAVLAVACCGIGWTTLWWAGLGAVITVGSIQVLLPRARIGRATHLANIDRPAHQRHVLALQHARTRAAVDRRYHQDGPSAIAGSTLTMEEYQRASRQLRRESAQAADPERIELALGTLTGDTPWSSGLAGLALGSIIGVPFILVTLARAPESTWSAEQAGSIAMLALIILHTVRWAVYGLVYGFFYPRLRGRSAFAKAAWFTAVMLPAELFNIWLTHNRPSVMSALGTDAIQLCAFAAILALAWEIRQARRAGVGWDGVRDLRSLRALAAPAGALALAIITAAATALASTEIPNWVGPQQTASTPKTVATSTPNPNAAS